MAKLVAVRLSNNPERETIAAKGGVDGNASKSTGGKPYVVLEFVDDKNIFKFSRAVRPYWAQGEGDTAKWAGATPEQLKAFVGKDVPGKFVTMPVAPYTIKGEDGVERTIGSYTTFVMPHESADTVFTKAGHTVLNEDGTIKAEPVNAGQPNEMAA
jgi:hypothetical protein